MKLVKRNDQYAFYCPGCEQIHFFDEKWFFDGDYCEPTVSPSILVRGTVPITDEEYERIMAGEHVEPKPFICHSFVTDGKINFLTDCTHKLAGQSVDMPDIEE